MKCLIVKKRTSFDAATEGMSAYHSAMFHGQFLNHIVDDNNLGDVLTNNLRLQKNAYDLRYIFQPQRNLVIPEAARHRLSGVPNISFFPVIFEKLFFASYRKGDLSLGPDSYHDLEKWLDSFKHEKNLLQEIEDFYEMILPNHSRVVNEFSGMHPVKFDLEPWRKVELALSTEMVSKYPAIWTVAGIVFRTDVFELIQQFFNWDYFNKAEANLV